MKNKKSKPKTNAKSKKIKLKKRSVFKTFAQKKITTKKQQQNKKLFYQNLFSKTTRSALKSNLLIKKWLRRVISDLIS